MLVVATVLTEETAMLCPTLVKIFQPPAPNPETVIIEPTPDTGSVPVAIGGNVNTVCEPLVAIYFVNELA